VAKQLSGSGCHVGGECDGQGMGVLDGVVIVKVEGAFFRVNLGHPIVTNEDFIVQLCKCA